MAQSWIYLLLAGVMEIGWALAMKYSNGFSKLVPSILTVVLILFSVYFLTMALKELPVGTAYSAWTGIGAVGTAIAGIILFGEAATFARLACIGLIVAGIVGLHVFSKA